MYLHQECWFGAFGGLGVFLCFGFFFIFFLLFSPLVIQVSGFYQNMPNSCVFLWRFKNYSSYGSFIPCFPKMTEDGMRILSSLIGLRSNFLQEIQHKQLSRIICMRSETHLVQKKPLLFVPGLNLWCGLMLFLVDDKQIYLLWNNPRYNFRTFVNEQSFSTLLKVVLKVLLFQFGAGMGISKWESACDLWAPCSGCHSRCHQHLSSLVTLYWKLA